MNFYQAMQLGAANLKPLIKKATDKKEKRKHTSALIIKDILCMIFCIVVITLFTNLFGSENSIVGVVTVIAILTYRLSNLGFDAKQSAIAMLGIFAIFMVGPYFASISSPLISFVINFVSIMTIVILACYNTMLANQSILVLSYIILYGYTVSSGKVYLNRIGALAFGGVVVATILYLKNRKRDFKVTFKDVIKGVNLKNDRTKWQLKLTLGICLGMLIAELMHMPKSMWIGFSCLSLLQPDKKKLDIRCIERPLYTIIGCIIFLVIYSLLPESVKGNMGMLGGLLVGLAATYKWQTVFNLFGAVIGSIPLLGVQGAIILRIGYVIYSAVFVKLYNAIFDKISAKLSNKELVNELVEVKEVV